MLYIKCWLLFHFGLILGFKRRTWWWSVNNKTAFFLLTNNPSAFVVCVIAFVIVYCIFFSILFTRISYKIAAVFCFRFHSCLFAVTRTNSKRIKLLRPYWRNSTIDRALNHSIWIWATFIICIALEQPAVAFVRFLFNFDFFLRDKKASMEKFNLHFDGYLL